jgi:hypothetical protein
MTPAARDVAGRRARILIALLVLGVVAFRVGHLLSTEHKITGGGLSLPLDDSFIYLQYSKAIAQGHPFVYTPGNAPTTGATSLWYPLLLLPPHLLHLAPDFSIAWAVALGAVGLVLSALLLVALGLRLGGPAGALIGTALFLANPHLLWGYMSGMEIALYGTVLLATTLAYVVERREGRFRATRWWLFALAGSRPEGAILCGVFGVFMAWDRRRASRAPGGPRFLAPALLLPFAAAALPFLVNLAVSGSIESTSAQAKSIFAEPYRDTREEYIRKTPGIVVDVAKVYLSQFETTPGGVVNARVAGASIAGLLLLALLSVWPRGAQRSTRPPALALLSLLAAGFVVSSVPVYWWVHLFRYMQGFAPLLLVAVAAGWGRLAWLAWARLPRALAWSSAVLVTVAPLALAGPILLEGSERITLFYGFNCENILHQQVKVGRWIDRNLPRDAIVGINDAGALAYYGKRRTVDMIGLTTEGFARVYRSGLGCLFEHLRRLPPGQLPTYFAIYPDWFPYWRQSGILGPEIFRAHLAVNTICGGTDKVVYPATWIDVRGTDEPEESADAIGEKRRVDSLDLAWLDDERRHDWRADPEAKDVLRQHTYAAHPTRPLTDGGRIVRGGERFRVSVAPGKDLLMIMRTDAWYPTRLRVAVDGKPAGVWEYAMAESSWVEPRTTIPGALLTRERPEIEIVREGYRPEGKGGPAAETAPELAGRDYAPFHYWFYQ